MAARPARHLPAPIRDAGCAGDGAPHPVQCVSYPYSSSDARVLAAARAAGFRAGVTGRGKINPRRVDPLGLRRVKPSAGMSMGRFGRILLRERLVRW